jgi:hypothetical protein
MLTEPAQQWNARKLAVVFGLVIRNQATATFVDAYPADRFAGRTDRDRLDWHVPGE